MCTRCRSPRKSSINPTVQAQSERAVNTALASVDSDFILCDYKHANIGDHLVLGNALFNDRIPGVKMRPKTQGGMTAWRIDYGYKGGGSSFPVHRRDIQLAPHLFVPKIAQTGQVVIPQSRTVVPPAPQVQQRLSSSPQSVDPLEDLFRSMGQPHEKPVEKVISVVADIEEEEEEDVIERLLGNVPESKLQALGIDAHGEQAKAEAHRKPDLQTVPGITADIAAQMNASGILSIDDLKMYVQEHGYQVLSEFRGIADRRAEAIAAFVSGSLDTHPPKMSNSVPPELAELGITE